jgi:hypothetical protein
VRISAGRTFADRTDNDFYNNIPQEYASVCLKKALSLSAMSVFSKGA